MGSTGDRVPEVFARLGVWSWRKRMRPTTVSKTLWLPFRLLDTTALRQATRCRNWYVVGEILRAVLTLFLPQGRIGQDTLSAMIRQDETATRSSRRRFYDVYTSQGDLLGKLRYPAGESSGSCHPESFGPHYWKYPGQTPHLWATGSKINSALEVQSPQCS